MLSPLALTINDLLVLSSDMQKNNPSYRELPPKDLWPNMKRTLQFLAYLSSNTGITFKIWSAYRSDVVNALSGGAHDSAHMDFSGLDVQPSQPARFEAFIKYYWYVQGRSHQLGLGYYARNRVHIDVYAKTHRRWEWDEPIGESRRRYQRFFKTTPLPN